MLGKISLTANCTRFPTVLPELRLARPHEVAVSLVCAVGVGVSEAMSCVAEAALGESEDFRWANSEHERGPDVVSKAILTNLVSPSAIPLLRPSRREPAELLRVGDAGRLALDNHVEAALPVVGARGQRDARVTGEVARLLLIRACGEVQCVVEPDGDERSDVWAAVGTDGRDPEDPGLLDRLKRVLPTDRPCCRIAESGVELCAGCPHHGFLSSGSRVAGGLVLVGLSMTLTGVGRGKALHGRGAFVGNGQASLRAAAQSLGAAPTLGRSRGAPCRPTA